MKVRPGGLILIVALVPADALRAWAPAPSEAPAAAPCTASEHRQFDFWIGDWEVRTPPGQVAGHNRIESILKGCAIHESWTGAGGMKGQSLNTYDPADRRWHQLWVDESGTVLHLAGVFKDGRMVLEGSLPSGQKPGPPIRQRITWERQADARVRQVWEASEDGTTWSVVFDGFYSRVTTGETAPPNARP